MNKLSPLISAFGIVATNYVAPALSQDNHSFSINNAQLNCIVKAVNGTYGSLPLADKVIFHSKTMDDVTNLVTDFFLYAGPLTDRTHIMVMNNDLYAGWNTAEISPSDYIASEGMADIGAIMEGEVFFDRIGNRYGGEIRLNAAPDDNRDPENVLQADIDLTEDMLDRITWCLAPLSQNIEVTPLPKTSSQSILNVKLA